MRHMPIRGVSSTTRATRGRQRAPARMLTDDAPYDDGEEAAVQPSSHALLPDQPPGHVDHAQPRRARGPALHLLLVDTCSRGAKTATTMGVDHQCFGAG